MFTFRGSDEVEKSLELLDKVLSEFEEETENSPPTEPESPSQGHQSEDDGYMSMNGRRAKFVPDFQPTDEVQSHPSVTSTTNTAHAAETLSTDQDIKREDEQQNILSTASLSPPSPEEAEKFILNLLPRISPSHSPQKIAATTTTTTTTTQLENSSSGEKLNEDWKIQNISLGAILLSNGDSKASSLVSNTVPEQTTLPKTRPTSLAPPRYASLPSTSPPRHLDQNDSGIGVGDDTNSLGSGRNILGIGISAVHDAVLRGMAKMPETIINEHPVTIYPGRSSPSRRVPPRTLPGSIERHREVCRQNFDKSSDSSTTSPSSSSHNTSPEKQPFYIHQHNNKSSTSIRSEPALITNKFDSTDIHSITFDQYPPKMKNKNFDNDEDRFSEDSLEETSLPPPPPPPVVPPPPSLSAPVTPSKRHSIAWEINLDDSVSLGEPQHNASNKKMRGNRGKLPSGSQSSINSTPGHSSTSNNKKSGGSSDWPDPPDIPICSTEDEANSIYSDSDGLIPDLDQISGKCGGTYVIRKGRKQRQRLDELDSLPSSKYNSNEDNLSNVPSPVFPASINIPNSRHSIDLGATTSSMMMMVPNKQQKQQQQQMHSGNKIPVHSTSHHASLNAARSRLSLDLNSPRTSSVKSNHFFIQFHSKPNNFHSPTTSSSNSSGCYKQILMKSQSNNNIISSPNSRYQEFKTFNSAFDGLQALEKNNNVNNGSSCNNTKNNNITINNNNNNNNNHSGDNNSPSGSTTTTTTSIMINCGGGGGRDISPVSSVTSTTNNSNISSVLLNSTNNGVDMLPLSRSASLPIKAPSLSDDAITPRRDLAPPIEEDEEHSSLEMHDRPPPLQEIENNISALLRGDIPLPRCTSIDLQPSRRTTGFRLGVHKSESAKEMKLQQPSLGPLPPSPPSCSPEPDSDEFPPLPPSPSDNLVHGMHGIRIASRGRINNYHEEPPALPPHVPPHRGPSLHTLKTRSMDAGFSKSHRNGSHHSNQNHQPGTLPSDLPGSINSRRRVIPAGYPRRAAQSPTKDERRLQSSCSLPETPIFGRGCDIPRTPHRRAAPETPVSSISRTAPRPNNNSLNSSVIGIGATALGSGRQRHLNQALVSTEMLRLAGGPARGWYPKQRQNRPSSAENLDKLHVQGSLRAWDTSTGTGTGSRKPLTLPPNLTPPKFFNSKSPRDALRRVTSLLIRKGNTVKEKENKGRDYRENNHHLYHRSPSVGDETRSKDSQKKKGFFRNFWKKSKHYSLDQHQ
uniref:CSON007459 protein n=1 Tax=Culicoides sonorensis TaxID=179676 RepID=A0A336LXU0_CULSO